MIELLSKIDMSIAEIIRLFIVFLLGVIFNSTLQITNTLSKKAYKYIEKFVKWLDRVRKGELTSEEIENIRRYLHKDNPKPENKYLLDFTAGKVANTKVKKPSRRQWKLYEERENKQKEMLKKLKNITLPNLMQSDLLAHSILISSVTKSKIKKD